MTVYRLTQAKYADKLLASGVSNRWNRAEQYVIYTSESISLCALELLAHTNGIRPKGTFKLMHIDIPNSINIAIIASEKLPLNWHLLASYPTTQKLGSDWYDRMDSLAMKIPSAIVPSESNYIVNAKHPAFNEKIQLVKVEDFFWDHRFPAD